AKRLCTIVARLLPARSARRLAEPPCHCLQSCTSVGGLGRHVGTLSSHDRCSCNPKPRLRLFSTYVNPLVNSLKDGFLCWKPPLHVDSRFGPDVQMSQD